MIKCLRIVLAIVILKRLCKLLSNHLQSRVSESVLDNQSTLAPLRQPSNNGIFINFLTWLDYIEYYFMLFSVLSQCFRVILPLRV